MVIYEKEAEYASELSGYLSRQESFPYRVATFTGEQSLGEFLKGTRPDVMLVGDDCCSEDCTGDLAGLNTIRLTEENAQECGAPWIFKYQSAGNIMREITAYTAGNPAYRADRKGPKLYSVFAPKGGVWRSEYALSLARELADDGRVLYVNMDPFPACMPDTEEEWRGMSEAIYYLKTGAEHARWKIKGLLSEKDGIKILGPAHCSMDLVEMTKEDAECLIDVIADMCEFEYVVLDIGFYSEAMLELCAGSDSISLITPEGEEYEQSTAYFMNQLKVMQRGFLEGRIEIVKFGGGETGRRDKRGINRKAGLFTGMEG